MSEFKEFYITKYWYSCGIIKRLGKVDDDCKDCLWVLRGEYYYKPHWHENKEDAAIRALDLKNKKIKSVKKLLANLEKYIIND